ncbi:MAG TPA: DUF4416 family protein [Syntrophorhabdaceae bacterium]|nr:DUF4416 family protein [Syntrophorhabdaceae bacterium]
MFFAGILSHGEENLHRALDALTTAIDTIEIQAPLERFTYTDYYEKEMGSDLLRTFVLFKSLKDREFLADIKLVTNEIEQTLAIDSGRVINLDPGYIALEHVILATTKGYSHRIYLRNGIYADLTLVFKNGTYRALEWTYPDYADARTIILFNDWRGYYKKVMKCQKV